MWDQANSYLLPWSLGIMTSVVLLVYCRRKPELGRYLLGSVFLLGGLANIYLAWIYPRDYLIFGHWVLLPSYRRFIYLVLFRQAIWMGGLLVVLHFYLAYVFLRKAPLTRATAGLAGAFLLLLAPLGFGAMFPATLLLLIGVYHLYQEARN